MVSNKHTEIVNNYTYLEVKLSKWKFYKSQGKRNRKNKEILFCRSMLSRFSKIINSHRRQTVQYTIFSNFNASLRSLANL